MTAPRTAAVVLISFLVAVVAQDARRDDVSPVEHWVSHLSLGPYGWVNVAALIAAGLGALLLRTDLRARSVSQWPARWVTVAGVGLVLAGAFVSDPPPGTEYDEVVTFHGQLHDIGGGLTFIGLFATCLTTRKLISVRWGLAAAVTVAAAWVAASVLAAVGYSDTSLVLPSGLAERLAIFAGIGWLIALALALTSPPSTTGAPHEL